MKTYTLFGTKMAKENTPFEGQEIKIYIVCNNGESADEIFCKNGFLAAFVNTEDEVNNFKII